MMNREPLQYEQLLALPEPQNILQIHERIEQIQLRQMINMVAIMRCKNTYRRHLATIVELDTVAYATLSYHTYRLLRDAEGHAMARTEATMAKMRQQGTHLGVIKAALMNMESTLLTSCTSLGCMSCANLA